MGAVGTSLDLTAAKDAIESAKSTVQFAPMIAVLFVATRMRALQMTDNKGAPQGWVQDGMYLATWSILIQFMMCLIMPLFTGKKFTPDSLDGPVATDGTLPVDLAPQPPGVNDIPGAKGAMKDVGKTVGGSVETVDGATETVTGTVTGF